MSLPAREERQRIRVGAEPPPLARMKDARQTSLYDDSSRLSLDTSIEVLQRHYSHITPEMVASRLASKIDTARKAVESQQAAIVGRMG